MKQRRRELILQAVRTQPISTQEQLLAHLRTLGIEATQATVSRDIRDLGLRKAAQRGGLACYTVPAEDAQTARRAAALGFIRTAEAVGNMLCVRCIAGNAQSVCTALDDIALQDVAGTLAGEDTIFMLCRNEIAARRVQEEISRYAANLND
ncbi:MAG: arginine repressor [Oscillospiraceae bacterium]|jgi:transcriptional regulator of arginine metabolism|nr:arginine repressor [Oscillospiraceae bacterium]